MTTITTPYGKGEVVGPAETPRKQDDGTTVYIPALYVRYAVADLTELGRAEIWRGGPCVYRVEVAG
jgi:hypothetical protein